MKLYTFRTVPLSIIRSSSLYTQQWYMSSGWNSDDGQRNCPKHVKFYSKNKFEKLVHLVGFILRIYHDTWSHECQISVFSAHNHCLTNAERHCHALRVIDRRWLVGVCVQQSVFMWMLAAGSQHFETLRKIRRAKLERICRLCGCSLHVWWSSHDSWHAK
jgi:hypothetical protein